jgi:hypothetical protein
MKDPFTTNASIGGERLSSYERPTRFAEDRRCATGGCQTRLSVYNPGEHCSLHESLAPRPPDPRRRRRQKVSA